MWIMSVYGFFSIASADKPGTLKGIDLDTVMVRARSRGHLENLRTRFDHLAPYKIVEIANRDYGFRMIMPKEDWVKALDEMAREQEWSNFKDECHKNRIEVGNEYISCLHRVWSVMLSLQPINKWWADTTGIHIMKRKGKKTRKAAASLQAMCACGHRLYNHGVHNPACLLCHCAGFKAAAEDHWNKIGQTLPKGERTFVLEGGPADVETCECCHKPLAECARGKARFTTLAPGDNTFTLLAEEDMLFAPNPLNHNHADLTSSSSMVHSDIPEEE